LAGNFNVKFKGIKNFFDELDISKNKSIEYSKTGMKTAISRASEKAQKLAPVDTGYLRRNIQPKPVEESHGVVVGQYVAQADYSSYNEYGTYKMAAHPFMAPSVAATTAFFYKAVKDTLKEAGKFS